MTEKICCFTGHRPGKLELPEEKVRGLLEITIRQTVCDGFHTYISGMAAGTDLIAAEIILQLRDADPRLKLICAMPFEGFGEHWQNGWTERMRRVLSEADCIKYVSKSYFPAVFQIRNQWMVDRSACVIAVFNGERGGTKNTLDYAKKKGVPCIMINGK